MDAEHILRKIVSINSIFPNESSIGEFVADFLSKRGFKVSKQSISKNRFNVFAEKGESKKAVMFYGHLDTVPLYGKWHTDPFLLTNKSEKLHGLGACDMKGGIAAILSAAINTKLKGKIKLLFCVDEENISEGAWEAVKKRKKWFSDICIAVVAEPGGSEKMIGGANVITLGRRGRAVFAIEIFGRSSHGALLKKGENAISHASRLVLALDKMKLTRHRKLGSGTGFVRKIESNSTSLSIPDYAYIELDRHMVYPETTEKVKAQLEKKVGEVLGRKAQFKVSLKQRKTRYLSPCITDIHDPNVRKILDTVKERFGSYIENYGMSVADDNVFANSLKIPIVTIGPSGNNLHCADEWVSKKSLLEVEKLFCALIEEKEFYS